jgi:hypothetical protein
MRADKSTGSLTVLAVIFLAGAALAGCSGGSATATVDGFGHLEVHLTDAPLDLSNVAHVFVTITDVLVYPGVDGMDDPDEPLPMPLMTTPREFDLLTLMGGITDLLAEEMIPAGFYQRVRLVVSEAKVVFTDGSEEPLKIESHKVDVVIPFELQEGDDVALLLDFDAAASVKVTATGSDRYILRPVVNGSQM